MSEPPAVAGGFFGDIRDPPATAGGSDLNTLLARFDEFASSALK